MKREAVQEERQRGSKAKNVSTLGSHLFVSRLTLLLLPRMTI